MGILKNNPGNYSCAQTMYHFGIQIVNLLVKILHAQKVLLVMERPSECKLMGGTSLGNL